MTEPRRKSVFRVFKPRGGVRSSVKPARSGEALRSLVIVVPLTLLIWVYAERAQNRDYVVTTQLDVATADPNLAAAVTDGDARATITFNGPLGLIDVLKERIEMKSVDGRLRVVLPAADATVGERSIDVTRLLNETPLLANSGVTVMKTTPQQLRLTVDKIVPSNDVTIVLPPRPPVTLRRVSFDPPRLTVRGPAQLVNQQFGGDSPTIAVDLSTLVGLSASGETTREVAVVPPADSRLTLSTSKVKLTFEIGSTITTGTIRSVFVDVRRPVSEDGSYKVVIRKGGVINNVQITGPASDVNRLTGNQPQLSVNAVFKVSDEDRGRTSLFKPVEFPDLPAGVSVVGGPYGVTIDVVDTGGANR